MGEACSRCGHRTGIDGPSPAPSDTRQVLHSIRRARRCNRASQETRPWSSDTSTMAVGWIRAVHRCAEAYRGGARGQAAPNLTGSVGSLLVAGPYITPESKTAAMSERLSRGVDAAVVAGAESRMQGTLTAV